MQRILMFMDFSGNVEVSSYNEEGKLVHSFNGKVKQLIIHKPVIISPFMNRKGILLVINDVEDVEVVNGRIEVS